MAARTTAGLEEAIANGWPITYLVYFDHPDGAVRLWAGVGNLSHGGNTYQGIGLLGRIPDMREARQIAVRTVTLELRGIPDDAADYLNKDVRNQAVTAGIAGMKPHGRRVNGAPWQVLDALADHSVLDMQEGGTATLQLIASEPVFSIERAQNLALTPEWLNETFGDSATAGPSGTRLTGLDLISSLANRTESWTQS